MLNENVAVAQGREDALGRLPLAERRVRGGNERRVLEIRAVDAVDLPERRKIKKPRYLDDIPGIHVQFPEQQFEHVLGHVVGHLEADRGTEPPSGQFALECLEQVLVAILLDLEIGIACDAESVVLHHFHAGEEYVEVGGDEVLGGQEGRDRAGGVAGAGHAHEPVDVVGHLHAREVLSAGCGILHGDREIEAQPADVGERMGRVDGQRGQDREDLFVEVRRQTRAFLGIEVGPADDRDALVGERRTHGIEEHPGVLVRDLLGAGSDERQLFTGRESVRGPHRQSGFVASFQAGHPDHVELVEVRGEDREELCAFEQWQRSVLREGEHTGVEVEPAQFAVEIARRGQTAVRGTGGGGRRRGGRDDGRMADTRRPCSIRVGTVLRRSVGVRASLECSPVAHSTIIPRDSQAGQSITRSSQLSELPDTRRTSEAVEHRPGRGAEPEAGCGEQVVEGVDVLAQSWPGPVEYPRPRRDVGPCGVGAEPRVETSGRAAGEQRRGSRAGVVHDDRASAAAGLSECIEQLGCPQGGQVGLQRHHVDRAPAVPSARSASVSAALSPDSPMARRAGSGRCPTPHSAAIEATTGSGVTTVTSVMRAGSAVSRAPTRTLSVSRSIATTRSVRSEADSDSASRVFARLRSFTATTTWVCAG